MMTLEDRMLRPYNPRCYPHLPYVVRFCSSRVPFDEILEFAAEDLSNGVTGEAGWRVGGEDEDDGADDICGGFCGHPGVVAVFLWFRSGLLSHFIRGRSVEISGGLMFSLLGLLVAFET
jgi:hypothetical protein